MEREAILESQIEVLEKKLADMRCCGNCDLFLYGFNDWFYCRHNYIHIDQIHPWKACPRWLFDQADVRKRSIEG